MLLGVGSEGARLCPVETAEEAGIVVGAVELEPKDDHPARCRILRHIIMT